MPNDRARLTATHDHPDASGLAFLRPGAAVDGDGDRLLALGFPHLRALTDPIGEDEARTFAVELVGRYEPFWQLVWPRDAATAWLRLITGKHVTPSTGKPNARGQQALARTEPIDADEAKAMLTFLATRDGPQNEVAHLENAVLLLEAMVGPELVAEVLASALERIDPKHWHRPKSTGATTRTLAELVRQLGLVQLRLPEARAGAVRSTLARILARFDLDDPGSAPAALDRALNGAVGADRTLPHLAPSLSASRRNPRFYVHVQDDPELVTAAVRDHVGSNRYGMLDVRLAFLGTAEVLDLYAARWSSLPDGQAQGFFAQTVALLADPVVDGLLEQMAAESRAKRVVRSLIAARSTPG